LWNWATDLAINSLIPIDELPPGALIPGKELDLTKVKDPSQLEKWKKVSELIESLPLKQASEWYMTKLQQDKEISKIIEDGGKGEVGSLDDHGAWGDLSEEDRQVLKGKMKKALADAVKQSDRTGQWGSVDSDTREKLRKMASSAVDWKKVLHNFCGRSQRSTKRRTHKRVNRKYPYIHPGITRGHTSKVAIYFDQSGSVSKEECELFFGALSQLSKITTFKVFPFDYTVDDDAAFVWKRGQKVNPKRDRGGGTSFQAVQKHFDTKCIGEFDGLIILTDGECSDPGRSLKRRCWVLLPGRRLYFDPSPGDIVVQMDNPPACS
jgi:predicted metal-dependent peptidase